jgi:hypothetical protein
MRLWIWVDGLLLQQKKVEPSRWMRTARYDGNRDLTLFVLWPFHWPVRFWYYLGGRYMLWYAVYKMGLLAVEENAKLSSGKWRWPWCTKMTVDHLKHGHQAEIHHAQRSAWNQGFRVGFPEGAAFMQNQLHLKGIDKECSPN